MKHKEKKELAEPFSVKSSSEDVYLWPDGHQCLALFYEEERLTSGYEFNKDCLIVPAGSRVYEQFRFEVARRYADAMDATYEIVAAELAKSPVIGYENSFKAVWPDLVISPDNWKDQQIIENKYAALKGVIVEQNNLQEEQEQQKQKTADKSVFSCFRTKIQKRDLSR